MVSENIGMWSVGLLNLVYLFALYWALKHLNPRLSKRNIEKRYRFAVIFLTIGLIQTVSYMGYVVIPAYLLLMGYLYCGGAFLLELLQNHGVSKNVSWGIVIFSQVPIYALGGYFIGIFMEHHGLNGENTEN